MTRYTRDVVCYYHDPVKAPLLREAVLPGLRDLDTRVAAHLERGWLHGPHVRVRLRGAPPAVDTAAGRLAAHLAGYLRGHPSRVRLTPVQLSEVATAAGRAELVPPPYGPFEPDNTVRIETPDPAAVARIPGSPDTAEVRAALLGAGLPAIEATLARQGTGGDRPGARVRAAVTALTARAATAPGGLPVNYFSYRSHLEVYLHHCDPTGRVRAAHQAAWRRYGAEVMGLVADEVGADGSGGPLAGAWRRWSVEARRAAADAYERGVLFSASREDTFRRAARFADPALSRMYSDGHLSEFHRLLAQRTREPGRQPGFEIERFCINMLYLLLAVGDLTPDERYLAASLLCTAVEELTGVTWRERIAAMAVDPARVDAGAAGESR